MRIKFVQNFRGRETRERFYQIGDESETVEMAANLIKRGIAVEVEGVEKSEEVLPEVKVKPAPKPVAKKPRVRKTAAVKKEVGK